MANFSEDIQSAGFDTQPPMLDSSDFASWQQRIRLYCQGKDNGENILKSIDEGPFKMGKFRETLAKGAEGALHLGLEWDRVFVDLSPEEKDMYKADIRVTNILLQGSELTKDDRESQLYDEFELFCQNKGETIHDYYVRFMTTVKLNKGLNESNYDQLYAYLKQHEAHANENKMMLDHYNQHVIDPLALGRQNRGQGNNARGAVVVGNGGVQNRVGNVNPGQARLSWFKSVTIFVEDMMKSSPICLLSKASKNKSWLWHRWLNHLNFGTINDLARKCEESRFTISGDYSLWQLILNGDGLIHVTTNENGIEIEVPPKTAQALLARQRERKPKIILLLAIPDEYQLRFHAIKDAKTLWATIKSRFGGNVDSKKMQKNVLKQQFENFYVSDTEGLDKAYDRFQKLISLLEVHGAAVSNEDANQNFLRALPSSWNNVALIMKNKDGIDDLDIDDLYNNLKVFEADIKGSSGSSSNSQNVAFLSAEDTSSSNEVNTANGVSTASGHNSQGQASSSSYTDDLMFSFFANQSNSPQLDDEDLEQIDHDDLEEMDLKWECRAPRNQGNRNGDAGYRSRDNTRRTVPVETSDALVVQDNALIVQDRLGYDWSYIAQDEPTKFALMAYTANSSGSDTEANLEIVAYQLGLESVEAQLIVHRKNEVIYEEKIVVLKFEVKDKSNAITRLKNQLDETLREKDDLKAKLEQFETSSKNLNKLINSQLSAKDKTSLGYGDQLNENDSSGSELFNSVFDSRLSDGDDNQTNDTFKKDNGYHDIPPLLTGNYMPPLADLSFARLDDSVYRPTANKTSASVSQVEASTSQTSNTSVEMPRVESVKPSGVIIKD
ncbi:hypothetical protein Tco_0803639 [Tanacetum coccineum]|uniref:Uncharacterized protein n=1 Tax=Tanacetum coccineum TaxID=301880 RepID=A0ABQ5A4L2_9ASTR